MERSIVLTKSQALLLSSVKAQHSRAIADAEDAWEKAAITVLEEQGLKNPLIPGRFNTAKDGTVSFVYDDGVEPPPPANPTPIDPVVNLPEGPAKRLPHKKTKP